MQPDDICCAAECTHSVIAAACLQAGMRVVGPNRVGQGKCKHADRLTSVRNQEIVYCTDACIAGVICSCSKSLRQIKHHACNSF
jgi:hypothetical protein